MSGLDVRTRCQLVSKARSAGHHRRHPEERRPRIPLHHQPQRETNHPVRTCAAIPPQTRKGFWLLLTVSGWLAGVRIRRRRRLRTVAPLLPTVDTSPL